SFRNSSSESAEAGRASASNGRSSAVSISSSEASSRVWISGFCKVVLIVVPFIRRDGRSGFFAEGERRRTAARVLLIERPEWAWHFQRSALNGTFATSSPVADN